MSAVNYGLYDIDLTKFKDFDLSKEIDFGLIKNLEINNCKKVTVLDGKEEAICFNKFAFNMVKMSTEGKVLGIIELFEKYLNNDLTDYEEPLPYIE